ncbi:MAG: ATP-binding cassette domain-containing protein [Lachnospiraceae bacterium]|nr:ATP-binding cassette domain-containing protein [Lachnospiraceae bacterium]
MLYLERLIKNYGSFRAVDGLSLHVPKGDLFGFVGPNGAGKTTSIRMLCGLLKPDFGNIYIAGYELRRQSESVRRCIGYVPDFFGVYDNLKVREYMEFYGSIYGIEDMDIKKMTGDLLELVSLSGREEDYVDGLSRGMKQRLCVARALLHNPELLVLDEPSSGLDPGARVEMKELLMNLNSMGKTIIISSHILSDIAEMCTSVGIMNRGRLVTAGKMDDILEMGRNTHHVIISVSSDTQKAALCLKELPGIELVSLRENEMIVNFDGTDQELNRIIGSLMTAGVMVSGFRREETNLETLFMQLTSGAPQPGMPGQQPMGIPGQQQMGIPGQQQMGIPMQQPMGMPGQQSMRMPMQQPMGMPGQQPMGMPAQQPVMQQETEMQQPEAQQTGDIQPEQQPAGEEVTNTQQGDMGNGNAEV